MAQRRHHYEHAFEHFLRDQRVPYISVDEAKKSLLPHGVHVGEAGVNIGVEKEPGTLKNFDFMIYGSGGNLLVEVKGRRLAKIRLRDGTPGKPRMESWVPRDDIDALHRWSLLFGAGFEAMFVFMYWCDDVPPDGLFVETLSHRGRWYTMRCIDLCSYMGAMRVRSPKWGTMCLPSVEFERLSRPFSIPGLEQRVHAQTGFVREPVFEALGAMG